MVNDGTNNPRMRYKNKDSISLIVRCEMRCRDIIKASPDMPAKMVACQRSLTADAEIVRRPRRAAKWPAISNG